MMEALKTIPSIDRVFMSPPLPERSIRSSTMSRGLTIEFAAWEGCVAMVNEASRRG